MTPKATLWPTALCRSLIVTLIYALLMAAYFYSAPLADLGDTIMGPPIVQDALRAFIVVQIGRALHLRWMEFTPVQRLLWVAVAIGVSGNMARGHFSGTPLTLTVALLNVALVGLTWRLMNTPWREADLLKQLAARDYTITVLEAEAVDLHRENAALRARLGPLEVPHDRL